MSADTTIGQRDPNNVPTILGWDAVNQKIRMIACDANGNIATTGSVPSTTIGLSSYTGGGVVAGSITNTLVEANQIKVGAGAFYGWSIYAAAACTVLWFDALDENVSLGTTVPIWRVTLALGGTSIIILPFGLVFATCLTWASALNADGSGGASATLPVGTSLYA